MSFLSSMELVLQTFFIIYVGFKSFQLFDKFKPETIMDTTQHVLLIRVHQNPNLKYFQVRLLKDSDLYSGISFTIYPDGLVSYILATICANINIWLGLFVLVFITIGKIKFIVKAPEEGRSILTTVVQSLDFLVMGV